MNNDQLRYLIVKYGFSRPSPFDHHDIETIVKVLEAQENRIDNIIKQLSPIGVNDV